MKRKRRRLLILLASLAGLGTATGLSLSAFSGSLVFFVLPSELVGKPVHPGRVVRLGGLVQEGSVVRSVKDGEPFVRFMVTDGKASVPVDYTGILPGLFRQGQGVVVMGKLGPAGTFRAEQVLAKHDSAYMPRAVEEALKKRGLWNPAAGPPPPPASWDTMRIPTRISNRTGG